MKKLTFILAAFALVLGLSQCKKPNVPEYTGPIDGKIIQKATLTASNGNNGAKVDMDESQVRPGELDLAWEEGDKIYAYDGKGNVSVLTLVGPGGSNDGTFNGTITVDKDITESDYITFYYYGGDVDVQKEGTTTIDFSEQSGSLKSNAQEDNVTTVKGKLIAFGKAEYNKAGKYENVNLLVPFAIAKLAFKSFTGADINVTCDNNMPIGYTISNMGVLDYKDGAAKASSEMTFKEYDSSKPYYAVFVPTYEGSDPVEKEYTLRQGDKVETFKAAFSGAFFTAGGQGGTVQLLPDPFCFTAKEAGSTVKIKFGGFKYSTDGINFKDYEDDSTINLTNVGDKVYFKAKSTNDKIEKSFETTGNLKVSGNIMYLLNGTTPATTMTNANGNCFKKLFQNCTAISDASELQLPATTLAESCYSYMFNGCTSLTAAPELNSTSLANSCYSNMFNGCESLTAAPALNSTSLANSCYSYMFKGCISLTNAPALPATTLTVSCYSNMFFGCSSLVTAPELKATTLANECCQAMFKNCTNLTTAPELKATTLANYCYKGMFKGCSKLSSVTMLATNVNFTDCLLGWLADDAGMSAEKRTVFVAPGMVDAVKAKTPTTWNLIDFCFTAKQANSTVSMAKVETGGTAPTVTLEYSINGTAWNTFTVGTTVTLEKEGDKVYFRAGDGGNKKLATLVNPNPIVITYNYFVTTGDLSVGGNIMYLLDGTTPATTLDTDNTCCFSYLFFNCTAISDFSQLQLPATELADYCYYYMFQKCTGLETAPALPATALADYCYHSMFRGCTGLKTAPALQATELADRCYCNMFYDCTGLKTAPALPATELADRCYYSMFQGCTELSSAPALPATTLASFCYRSMFQGCTKLTTAPELKATALQESCYLSMFQNCTNLTTAPELKATTLAKQCYQGMFYGCTKLSSVTMLATSVSATSCLQKWLENAGSDASVTSAKLYVDKNMMTNTTITNSLPSQKWSVAAGN